MSHVTIAKVRLAQVVTKPLGKLVQQADRGVGDHRPGREDGGGPGLIELVEITGRDDAADHDHDVGAAHLGHRVAQRRNQRQVPGGQ